MDGFACYAIVCYATALITIPIVWACLSEEVRGQEGAATWSAFCFVVAPCLPVLAVIFLVIWGYCLLVMSCGGKLRPKPKPVRPPGLSDDEWLAKMKADVADFEAQCLTAAAESEGE